MKRALLVSERPALSMPPARDRVPPILALQRLVGNRTATALLQRAAAKDGVIQRNQILSHVYESSESPLATAVRFIADQTGLGESKVLKEIAAPDPLNKRDLMSDDAGYRPVAVRARIDDVTGSAGRGSAAAGLQTGIGHLGNLENLLRGRAAQEYDGGHLLGYGWYKDWELINSAKNVAPQLRASNRAIYGWEGAWGQEEIDARKVAKALPAIVNAYVNYATKNYTVSLRHLKTLLDPAGDAAAKIDSLRSAGLRFVTVDTRIPSQYVLTFVPDFPRGAVVPDVGPNRYADLDVTGAGARAVSVSRLVVPTLEDAVFRFVHRSISARGAIGGGVIDPNAELDFAGLAGEALRVAQFGIYYLAFAYGWPPAVIVPHVVAYYYGQGATAALLQIPFAMVSLTVPAWHEVANKIEGTLRYVTTVEGAVSLAKTAVTELTSSGYNTRAWYRWLTGTKPKEKVD